MQVPFCFIYSDQYGMCSQATRVHDLKGHRFHALHVYTVDRTLTPALATHATTLGHALARRSAYLPDGHSARIGIAAGLPDAALRPAPSWPRE